MLNEKFNLAPLSGVFGGRDDKTDAHVVHGLGTLWAANKTIGRGCILPES